MHREYLVEGNIKAIFWLTLNEGKQLARFSPDFWAFRHKVVEFLDLPSRENIKALDSSSSLFRDLYTKRTDDLLIRINTAEMFFTLGCIDEAILNFRKALRKYPDETAISLQIAEIYLFIGQLNPANRILRKAKKENTNVPGFSEEFNRLNQMANSLQYIHGGFVEQAL
jgi:tetratricopeptide (TPR) repeat protein